MNIIRRYPASSFFVIAVLFSWFFFFSQSIFLIYFGLYGPLVAAFIVVIIRDKKLHFNWLNFKDPHIAWVLLSIFIFPFIWAIGNSVGALFGKVQMAPWQESYWGNLHSLSLSAILYTTLLGGGQEEIGWRGFALPALQKSLSPLLSSIILGVIHAIWHLPLYINGWYGNIKAYDDLILISSDRILYNIPTTIIVTWFFNRTSGNLWLMILLHVLHNINPTPSSDYVLYALYGVAFMFVIMDKMNRSAIIRPQSEGQRVTPD